MEAYGRIIPQGILVVALFLAFSALVMVFTGGLPGRPMAGYMLGSVVGFLLTWMVGVFVLVPLGFFSKDGVPV
jgi:hypothetical protein